MLAIVQNPSWRYYVADVATALVTDIEQWHYDLNATYSSGASVPVPVLSYRATQYYGMRSVFPADWAALIDAFATNDTLFDRWYAAHNTNVTSAPCRKRCKSDWICSMSHPTHAACKNVQRRDDC